jgi:transposase
MRYELTDHEWTAIRPMLPNKPRGVPRVVSVHGCGGDSGVAPSVSRWCSRRWPSDLSAKVEL